MSLFFFGIIFVAASCAAKPEIQLNRTVYDRGDYELKCNFAEVGNETTFSWNKDDDDLNETSDTYQIADAKADQHNGNYTCTVTNGDTNSTSDPYHIVVLFVPGKKCDKDADCSGNGYKQKCNATEPGRCLCADGYQPVEDKCKGGASVVISSLALLLVALVSTRFLY